MELCGEHAPPRKHSAQVLSFLQVYGSYTHSIQIAVPSGPDNLVSENHPRATDFHIVKSNSDMATGYKP